MHLANRITSSRFLVALGMILARPLSPAFWLCYLWGGVSDLLDGFAARKTGQVTEAGARLDSLADMAFACAIAVTALRSTVFPPWLWGCIAAIALLRPSAYGVGFYKWRTSAALHTWANKATGILIFLFPALYALLGLTATGILLCLTAFFSAGEELAIIVSSRALSRDRKTIFVNDQEDLAMEHVRRL